MPKALSLFLPMWSIDLVKRRERMAERRRLGGNGSRASGGAWRENRGEAAVVVLIRTVASRQMVMRCCARAAASGVRIGMTLAHAKALIKSDRLIVGEFTPARDRAMLGRLAEWATRFSPAVAVDVSGAWEAESKESEGCGGPSSDGLIFDIAGCEHLFGGEQAMLRAVVRAVERRGFLVRGAIAPTFGAAWGLARYGRDPAAVVGSSALRAALESLPVAALRVEAKTAAQLAEVGVRTIGELLAIPRRTLPARFGAQLMLRIDQCFGQAVESIEPVRPRPPVRAVLEFGGPTTQVEAIDRAVRAVLERMTRELEERGCGLRRLDIKFGRVDAPPVGIEVALSRPSRDAGHLWSLLRPRVERVNLGFGVERVEATATRLGKIRHAQATSWNMTPEGGAKAGAQERFLGELADTLVNRLGADRVLREEVTDSHLPERVIVRRSVMESGSGARDAKTEVVSEGDVFGDRPSLLFDRADPADVVAMTPDGPPSWLRWRRQELSIIRGIGPERIGGEWWRAPVRTCGSRGEADGLGGGAGSGVGLLGSDQPWQQELRQRNRTKGLSGSRLAGLARDETAVAGCEPDVLRCTESRDYFKVQDQHGRWLWVYRESESARWFVHGIWA